MRALKETDAAYVIAIKDICKTIGIKHDDIQDVELGNDNIDGSDTRVVKIYMYQKVNHVRER